MVVDEGGQREWGSTELFGLMEYLEYGIILEVLRRWKWKWKLE